MSQFGWNWWLESFTSLSSHTHLAFRFPEYPQMNSSVISKVHLHPSDANPMRQELCLIYHCAPTSTKTPGTQYMLSKYLNRQCVFLFQIDSSSPLSKPGSWQSSANSQLRQPYRLHLHGKCNGSWNCIRWHTDAYKYTLQTFHPMKI